MAITNHNIYGINIYSDGLSFLLTDSIKQMTEASRSNISTNPHKGIRMVKNNMLQRKLKTS